MSKSYLKTFIDYTTDLINRVQEENKLSFEKEAEIYYYKKLLEVAKQLYTFEEANNNPETRLNELKKENEQMRTKLAVAEKK